MVESLWREQSVWSQAADRLKRDLTRWRAIAHALTVAEAVLATVETQVNSINWAVGTGLV